MKSNDIKDKRIWIADTQYKVTEQKYQGQTIWSSVKAPGPSALIAGNKEAGFYGEVLSDELINGEELATILGLTAGTAVNTTEPWLKFSWQGKVQYMPKKHIRHNLTWNQLLNVNAIYGDNVITIKGVKYKVRLMSSAPLGALGDFTSATSQVHYSEWNKLMHPIHERARTGSWYTKSNVESDIENWNINYTNADLGFGTMYNFTSTSVGTSTTGGNFVNRGYYDPSFSASWAKSVINGSFGWRPVLEVASQSGGETPTGIRYIRDIINGNTINTANHWIEIMAFENDVNVARGKLVLVDGESGVYKAETITDGNTANTQNSYRSGGNIVVIDLGDLYKVDRVQVWHYYGDNRKYHKAKTEVSADGINWITLYDSDVDGTYTETAEGKTHYVTAEE